MEWKRGSLTVSDDFSRLDLDAVHAFLTTSYWSPGISKARVERALRASIVFGLYDDEGRQIGFARALTDHVHVAYLADVYVLEAFRGRGLARWLVECVLAHPDLQGLRRWMLATRDAHELYRKLGFTELKAPERFMERNP